METIENFAFDDIGIEDPTRDPVSSPYLILELYKMDRGELLGRDQRLEYVNRTPICVSWGPSSVQLKITNNGNISSDLVKVEYQVVYCIDPEHRVADGFTISHADEVTIDDHYYVEYVPPRDSIFLELAFPPPPPSIANLYFRARVSTLWSGKLDPANWDVLKDPAVTEAAKRFI